jgi:hypothetical protein
MSKFCVEVLTKDFGLAREAIFIVDRDHLAEQVADIVAISPHVACTVSRAPAEALITPEWPSFLAGLTEHLRGPRIDLPNPSADDPDGKRWAKRRAAAVAQALGGFVQSFPGCYAVDAKGQREPALIVQYVAAATACGLICPSPPE